MHEFRASVDQRLDDFRIHVVHQLDSMTRVMAELFEEMRISNRSSGASS
jgi:hypothetical protein